jgi:hypothetical protein
MTDDWQCTSASAGLMRLAPTSGMTKLRLTQGGDYSFSATPACDKFRFSSATLPHLPSSDRRQAATDGKTLGDTRSRSGSDAAKEIRPIHRSSDVEAATRSTNCDTAADVVVAPDLIDELLPYVGF